MGGTGGASWSVDGLPLFLRFPNEKARAARLEKEGGCGRGAMSAPAETVWYMLEVVEARFAANSSSSSGWRSGSTEDGNVEVELWRADAEEES